MSKGLTVSLLIYSSLALISAQYTGHGVSKSTYSANDPVAGKIWLQKYFPTDVPSDECTDDICTCPASGSIPEWYIQQGRVYLTRAGGGGGGHAGNGFGLHLVNVSNHLTTGGLSTAEVEAYFNDKLKDIASRYDSFLDYNVALATTADGLASYKAAFKSDGVTYLAGTWSASNGTVYTSIIVQVPNTQMVLELCAPTTLEYSADEPSPMPLEQRASNAALAAAASELDSQKLSGADTYVLAGLAVNRAASAASMAKLEPFYVDGMGTSMSYSSSTSDATKKCFLWTGATMDVCYTNRSDSATSGDFKVSDFESMLNKVHSNLMEDHPFCGQDKWEDNHYAIDSRTADTSKMIKYIDSNGPFHYCEKGSGIFGSTSLHYVWDPTGWGIQLDLSFSSVPADCDSGDQTRSARLFDHTNPACTASSDCGSMKAVL